MLLTEVLSKFRIPYTTQHKDVRAGWVGLNCPWCRRSSAEMYLGINLLHNYATCWRCGPKRIVEIIVKLGGVNYAEAAAALGQVPRPRAVDKPQGNFRPLAGAGPLLPCHEAYLRGRGLDPAAVVQLWGIGGTGMQSRLGWSLYIPVRQYGQDVSWLTRSIGTGTRRYVAAKPEEEAVSHKTLLYGLDMCRGAAVVVEGAVDAWVGGPGFVATMGLSVSPAQIAALAAVPRRAICYDAEPEAQRRARRLAAALAPQPGTTEVIELETGKDIAVADKAEVAEIRHAFLE